MEVLPAATPGVGRFNFASELLWRYPIPLPPQMDFRTQLPRSLGSDPRQWSRESVASFLQWCQFEFDLPQFNMEKFQMNGKALCLLTKADLADRCHGSGDVLHNVLQMLVRDSSLRETDHSPLTPHFPHPWQRLLPSPSPHAPGHPISSISAPPVSFSVTLSPVPSKLATATSLTSKTPPNSSKPPVTMANIPQVTLSPAPPTSPHHDSLPQYSHNGLRGDQDSQMGGGPHSPAEHCIPYVPPAAQMPSSPSFRKNELCPSAALLQSQNSSGSTPPHSPVHKLSQFSLSEPVGEANSNGRLLWDFLQQLLNDAQQRYTAYIAWKNREVGVFKIVDPPGLAKLWGIQKNHLSMNYDKMSRALRYYYRVNILRKVQGERHCYQFLRNPSELRSIKNMSMLRQQPPPAQPQPQPQIYIKNEPQDADHEDIQPTDLSSKSVSLTNTHNNNNNNSMSWSQENGKTEPNSINNNNNNISAGTGGGQGMKLQLNMWTQENGKTEPPTNGTVAGSNVQPHAIKTEET